MRVATARWVGPLRGSGAIRVLASLAMSNGPDASATLPSLPLRKARIGGKGGVTPRGGQSAPVGSSNSRPNG